MMTVTLRYSSDSMTAAYTRFDAQEYACGLRVLVLSRRRVLLGGKCGILMSNNSQFDAGISTRKLSNSVHGPEHGLESRCFNWSNFNYQIV